MYGFSRGNFDTFARLGKLDPQHILADQVIAFFLGLLNLFGHISLDLIRRSPRSFLRDNAPWKNPEVRAWLEWHAYKEPARSRKFPCP